MKIFITSFLILLISPFSVLATELELFYRCKAYQPVDVKKLPTGHDVIDATLNGVKARFIVDTGAKFTVINDELLGKYHIDKNSLLGEEKGAGAAGELLIQTYPLESFQIDNHKIEVSMVGTTSLSHVINGFGLSTGVWVDGIIGQDVLLTHFGIIDNRKKQLLLKTNLLSKNGCESPHDLGEILSNLGYHAIPLNILDINLATIKMAINGELGEFILDSGAGDVIVNNDSLVKFHLDNNQARSSKSSSGAGGAITLKTVDLDYLQIGTTKYSMGSVKALDLSAVVSEVKTRSQTQTHGVVGQDLLQRYQSIISFHDNTLYLKPRRRWPFNIL